MYWWIYRVDRQIERGKQERKRREWKEEKGSIITSWVIIRQVTPKEERASTREETRGEGRWGVRMPSGGHLSPSYRAEKNSRGRDPLYTFLSGPGENLIFGWPARGEWNAFGV